MAGRRIDLTAYQPDAWAVLRPYTVHGLQQALLRLAQERGVDLAALGDPASGAALALADQLDVLALKYQVEAWQIATVRGDALPPPSAITAADLEWVDARIVAALLAAIRLERETGDAAVSGPPNPPSASGAS
jgi:hypothetical protein